jgi:hypothetical protein
MRYIVFGEWRRRVIPFDDHCDASFKQFGSKIGIENEVNEAVEHAACVAELFETQNGCICCSGK